MTARSQLVLQSGWDFFKNAEYVVSDSFHGVVFALIFNRKFFAKVNGHHMNRRVQQLLNLVKLTDRTMDDVSYENTEEIDFTYANEQIATSVSTLWNSCAR